MTTIERDSQWYIINHWQNNQWYRIKVFNDDCKRKVLHGKMDAKDFRFCEKSKMWVQKAYA